MGNLYTDAVVNVIGDGYPAHRAAIAAADEEHAKELTLGLIAQLTADHHSTLAFSVAVECALVSASDQFVNRVIALWNNNRDDVESDRSRFLSAILDKDQLKTSMRQRTSLLNTCMVGCAQLVLDDFQTVKQLATELHHRTHKNRYALDIEFADLFTAPMNYRNRAHEEIQAFFRERNEKLEALLAKSSVPEQRSHLYFYRCLLWQRMLLVSQELDIDLYLEVPPQSAHREFINVNWEELHQLAFKDDMLSTEFPIEEWCDSDDEDMSAPLSLGIPTCLGDDVRSAINQAIQDGCYFNILLLFEGGSLPRFDAAFLNRVEELCRQCAPERRLLVDDGNIDKNGLLV